MWNTIGETAANRRVPTSNGLKKLINVNIAKDGFDGNFWKHPVLNLTKTETLTYFIKDISKFGIETYENYGKLTGGYNNIGLGWNCQPLTATDTYSIVIGPVVTGLGSSTTVLGYSGTTLTAIYGQIAIGTTSVVASAQVQINSTTKGFLPPRMTNAQRTSISLPAVGLCVYCTDATEGLYINKSTGWTYIG